VTNEYIEHTLFRVFFGDCLCQQSALSCENLPLRVRQVTTFLKLRRTCEVFCCCHMSRKKM